ncbi:hypothetical protein BDZ89DRAFT_1072172 [Hymenopellis radicata]|nr:hypothetical protein BDZ89DRAFT_1072172 [Hymenopellis radicata]
MADTATARTSFIATSATNTAPTAEISPELSQTLALLSTHRSVLGYILLAHPHHLGGGVSIIRSSGVIFDGDAGRKYAAVIARIVDSVRDGMEEVGEEDEVKFMRIRTRRHEIMISPDDKYLLAVLHDPTA